MVDGCCTKLADVVSGVSQGSVLGLQLIVLYAMELFSIVENRLYSCAGYSTLVAVVPFPTERGAVRESTNRNLNRVGVWCTCGE